MSTGSADGEHDIGEPHEHVIQPASVETRDAADQRPEDCRGDRRSEPHCQGNPTCVEQPGKDVMAELIGAQGVAEGRHSLALIEVHLIELIAGEKGRENRRGDEQENHASAHNGDSVLLKPPPRNLPVPFPGYLRTRREALRQADPCRPLPNVSHNGCVDRAAHMRCRQRG
jgi:hypothetical protein